jgi:hypothetical protein
VQKILLSVFRPHTVLNDIETLVIEEGSRSVPATIATCATRRFTRVRVDDDVYDFIQLLVPEHHIPLR